MLLIASGADPKPVQDLSPWSDDAFAVGQVRPILLPGDLESPPVTLKEVELMSWPHGGPRLYLAGDRERRQGLRVSGEVACAPKRAR